MERKYKIVVGALLLILLAGFIALGSILAIILSIGDSEPEEDSFSHKVAYSVELHTNGTLNDTELIVPYPEDDRFQSALNSSDPNISVRNDIGGNLSIVDTDKGEMLKIDIEQFDPETRQERAERHEDNLNRSYDNDRELKRQNVSGLTKYARYDLSVQIDYNRSLDTKNGLEAEPHLYSFSSECQGPRETGCASTKAYVKYQTSDDVETELDVNIEGRNSWWDWGWSGNSYSQRFYNSFYDENNLRGSQDRWITLTGREDQGEGRYLDE